MRRREPSCWPPTSPICQVRPTLLLLFAFPHLTSHASVSLCCVIFTSSCSILGDGHSETWKLWVIASEELIKLCFHYAGSYISHGSFYICLGNFIKKNSFVFVFLNVKCVFFFFIKESNFTDPVWLWFSLFKLSKGISGFLWHSSGQNGNYTYENQTYSNIQQLL